METKSMFKGILVPLDGSQLAERILPLVETLARKTRSEVHLLHVIERGAKSSVHNERHLTSEKEAVDYLAGLAGSMVPGSTLPWHAHAEEVRDVAASIADHARECEADLIALTTHGRWSLGRWAFGSIAQRTLALSQRALLLCPPGYVPGTNRLDRVMVPLDINPEHGKALTTGMALAKACGAELVLVGVKPTIDGLGPRRSASAQLQPAATQALLEIEADETSRLMDAASAQAKSMGLAVQTIWTRGGAGEAILGAIGEARPDIVVFATHARKGLDAWFTHSVGQQLCDCSTVPLLIVPVA